jgi:hypothetical protein
MFYLFSNHDDKGSVMSPSDTSTDRQKIIKILGLNETTNGQLVPPIEDFQADWTWTVNDIEAILTDACTRCEEDELQQIRSMVNAPDVSDKDKIKAISDYILFRLKQMDISRHNQSNGHVQSQANYTRIEHVRNQSNGEAK